VLRYRRSVVALLCVVEEANIFFSKSPNDKAATASVDASVKFSVPLGNSASVDFVVGCCRMTFLPHAMGATVTTLFLLRFPS